MCVCGFGSYNAASPVIESSCLTRFDPVSLVSGLTHIVGLCYELVYVFPRADGVSAAETAAIETSTQQALHYALAGAAQQVQIHRIGEDGQVQVVSIIISSSKKPTHTNIFKYTSAVK